MLPIAFLAPPRVLGRALRRALRVVACLLCVALAPACDDGRTKALEQLRSPTAEVRVDALTVLARSARAEDFPLLERASADPSSLVRRAAVDALAAMADPRAIDVLGGALADTDPAVQKAAAGALARREGGKARAYLIGGFARRGAAARVAIIDALALAGVGPTEPIRAEAATLRARHEEALQSPMQAEQVAAAEELGRSGRPEAREQLLARLASPSVLLAAASARGLGESGDPAVRPRLEPMLAESYPQLREAATEALARLGDPAAAPALAAVAEEDSAAAVPAAVAVGRLPGVASIACASLERVRSPAAAFQLALHARAGGSPCAAPWLVARLEKGGRDAEVALSAAAGLEQPDLLPAARRLLEDPAQTASVQVAAVRLIGAVGTAEDGARLLARLTPLSSALVRATSDWVRTPPKPEPLAGFFESEAASEEARGRYDDLMRRLDERAAAGGGGSRLLASTATRRLTIELVPDVSAEQEALAGVLVEALGNRRFGGASALIGQLLVGGTPPLRRAAARALGAIADPAALPVLLGVARADEEGEIRTAAAEAIGRLPGAEAAAAIAQLCQSTELAARVGALRGLAGRSDVALSEVELQGLAASGLPDAARALGGLGRNEAVPALVKALATQGLNGRLEVIEALGRLQDPAAAVGLRAELLHDRSEIRAAAARAIGRLDPKPSQALLTALANDDYYAEVRRAAAEALAAAAAR